MCSVYVTWTYWWRSGHLLLYVSSTWWVHLASLDQLPTMDRYYDNAQDAKSDKNLSFPSVQCRTDAVSHWLQGGIIEQLFAQDA